MLEQKTMMDALYNGILPTMQKCGFEPEYKEGASKADTAVYPRNEGSVMDFCGAKGRLRLVFNADRIHLLSGESDAILSDDTAFNIESTFLMLLDEYEIRDVKSLVNEINELLCEKYSKKDKIVAKNKIQTVSKNAARSGALSYDPVTLASKLAAMFPEIKDDIRLNMEAYGEFLSEEFFSGDINGKILDVIRENNPQKMKKLFNILGDVYEDGTNEVQSLIAVTVLGTVKNDPVLVQNMIPYLTDTMLEPVLSVGKRLAKSKSANLRLQNPPKYKPKKQKSPGFLSQLLGGGGTPGLGQ